MKTPDYAKYYIGNSDSGWNGAPWDVDMSTGTGASGVNGGVPMPFSVPAGTTITCCGIAYTTAPSTLHVVMKGFSCGNYESYDWTSSDFTQTFDINGVACFNASYTTDAALDSCTDYIVIGLRLENDYSADLEFSYSIHVSR
jgi:hypothetical protein